MNSDHPTLPAPATPPRRPQKRSGQPAGEHFDSPERRRRWRTDSEPVIRPGLPLLEQHLSTELEGLFNTYDRSRRRDDQSEPFSPINDTNDDVVMQSPSASPGLEPPPQNLSGDRPGPDSRAEPTTKRVLPDETAHRLYANWLALVPTLVSDYLGYMQRTQGRLGRPSGIEAYSCPKGLCSLENREVLCLHFDCTLPQSILNFPSSMVPSLDQD